MRPTHVRSFSRCPALPPDLTSWQQRAYERFLQSDAGLRAILREAFPIRRHDGKLSLSFVSCDLGEPTSTLDECRRLGRTWSRPLFLRLRLDGPEPIEDQVHLADLPVMFGGGQVLIHGTERVIVAQLGRAPGADFIRLEKTENHFACRIIPERGPRLELKTTRDNILASLPGGSFPALALLRALAPGSTNAELLAQLHPLRPIARASAAEEGALGCFLAADAIDPHSGEVLLSAGQPIPRELLGKMDALLVFEGTPDPVLLGAIRDDDTPTHESALLTVYRVLRRGQPVQLDRARATVSEQFQTPARYRLGQCGRERLNRKYGAQSQPPLHDQCLRLEDLLMAVRRLLALRRGEVEPDDIDHLANRRLRLVDDLLADEIRKALLKYRRGVQDRLHKIDPEKPLPTIVQVANHQAIGSAVDGFFSRHELSQVLDQTNPLAQLAHERRVSLGGPGGVDRRHARFDVRDVHLSHFGRLCPVETPEGEAIGLVTHLALHAGHDNGFLTTPLRPVRQGVIERECKHLRADEELGRWLAPADAPNDGTRLTAEQVIARREGDFVSCRAADVELIAASPGQLVGASAGLIPFLEHDDANRALMGANMQRQAVPLLFPEPPIVATGLEREIARVSALVVRAEEAGVVTAVSADMVHVGNRVYPLRKFVALQGGTCQNQRPIVRIGDSVVPGQVLADGAAIRHGELALGRNVLVAFMCWEGHNFEDAIIVSERLLHEHAFTSIHLEELDVELGDKDEAFTRDVPGVPARALVHLDENGLVRVGARVLPGDILVGKIAPRRRPEMTAEMMLLVSMFGRGDVANASLEVPPGMNGVVIAVQHSKAVGDVSERVRVVVATKRALQVGDKLAGRHGNKGVVSRIVPVPDMPHLADGTPVDVLLNPLGVPSRMNVGQIFETHLGWAASQLGFQAITPVFDGASEAQIRQTLQEAGLSVTGKTHLYDGRTGERFDQPITVGILYMLKLHHLVDEKIHARATGPYSSITQQPLGGRARSGGQRVGEMEVWALEAYGAAALLQEMMTLKADDVEGRHQTYHALIHGLELPRPGTPASVEVLRQELRGLLLELESE